MLILASQSPTRRALMANAGIAFDAVPVRVNERAIEAEALRENVVPAEIALRLAKAKALAWEAEAVIGSDQILAVDGEILHKAASLAEARERLNRLRARTHELHTAVALSVGNRLVWRHVETARLTMRAFSDDERDLVLAAEGEAVLGSVGAYRLEGPSVRLFETIEGDYFTILGLPLVPLLRALRHHAPHTLERFT